MAQELKELTQLLFPASTSGKCSNKYYQNLKTRKTILTNIFFVDNAEKFSEIADYIKKLGSQNWEYIRKEPDRLTEEMRQLTEQTQELAFTNYKTFVETAEISRTIRKDIDKSKDSLENFLESTPPFLQECERFSQVAGNIVKEKR